MPINITFDLPGSRPHDVGRIQSMFAQFGWEHVGPSSYRYPPSNDAGPEDWLNRVIPALMLFRSYIVTPDCPLSMFTVTVNSATFFNRDSGYGAEPTNEFELFSDRNKKFGATKLRGWLRGVEWPYPLDDRKS